LKRLVTSALAMAALLLVVAVPAAMAEGTGHGGVTVMVMKHACNPDVKNVQDFNAIKESADGPVAALAATVLACPTIVNPGDETSDGVKGEATSFAFTVADAEGTHELPGNTEPGKLCETDLGLDADGDGNISEDVCLDVSHYVFDVADGPVTVTESQPPAGYAFGELLFTPTEIDGNNDAASVVSIDRDAGVIELDTTNDEDGMIMLHVYNFQTTTMPDTATEAAPASPISGPGLLMLATAAAGFAALWFIGGLRRRETSSR
jgi:hypothetical protein